jgi:hypothetical protein
MIYSISNKQYDVCFNTANRAIDIGVANLKINEYLYKNNDSTPWKWSEIIALDTRFIGSVSLYLRTGDSYDIVQIKQDINTGNAIVIQTIGICPTQTPTPTTTPSNSATPTTTPTSSATPSQTVTNTPSSTAPLERFLYYISTDLETLCYNRYADPVKAISVYDTDNRLQVAASIYKNNTASTKWYYSEFILNLGLPSTTPRIYLLESGSGIVYSVISGTGGFATVESEQITCPPMRISNTRYNLCHTNSYRLIQVNTTNLVPREYLYKIDGVGKWTWSELIGLDSSFPTLTTLYLKRENSTITIGVKEDIATGHVIITTINIDCPTQTPTPTQSSTPTITPTRTPSQTSTPTSTPTASITSSLTSTPTQTPSQTPTKSQTPTQTQTPSNSPTVTQTPSNTQTATQTQTPTNTPTSSVTASKTPTPTQTPTYSPTPTDPLNGSYYYLSNDSYNICHNFPSNLVIIYDQGIWLEVNDVLYQTSSASDWYTMSELASFLGLPSLLIAYIRPVDNASETYRVRQIEANPDGKAYVTNIFQCVTPTPTATSTQTPTRTPSQTPTTTETPTKTPSQTPTNSSTSSQTPTQTRTSSQTPSITPSQTPTESQTPTPTQTPSNTPTESPTQTPTTTETPTQTPTITETPTTTPTNTPTNTETITPTVTPSQTPTTTETPTNTPTQTETPTQTKTSTPTPTPTTTETPTPSPTAVYIYQGINLNINNIITGNRYNVKLTTDDFGVSKAFPEEINFTGSYSPQRVNFKLGFAANISTVIVSAKITDLDTGRIEYNSVFIKCNSILDCY